MNEAITWTETMFLPGQDSVVGNPKCYHIPASPWGQVTLCWHRFCPRPDTCSTGHISTSTGRVRQAAGGGSRQRRWPHTCWPFSPATRTLRNLPHSQEFAAILSLCLPESTVTCEGPHLGGRVWHHFPCLPMHSCLWWTPSWKRVFPPFSVSLSSWGACEIHEFCI